jgi:hypothetical protein
MKTIRLLDFSTKLRNLVKAIEGRSLSLGSLTPVFLSFFLLSPSRRFHEHTGAGCCKRVMSKDLRAVLLLFPLV